MSDTINITVELPERLWQVLYRIADKTGMTWEEVANKLIEMELDKYELEEKDTG